MKWLLSLTRQNIRSLYAIAMLAGIVALSGEAWTMLYFVHHAVAEGEPSVFVEALLERLKYNALLTGLFALIVALTVFGADYLRAKWGDREIGFGKGEED